MGEKGHLILISLLEIVIIKAGPVALPIFITMLFSRLQEKFQICRGAIIGGLVGTSVDCLDVTKGEMGRGRT